MSAHTKTAQIATTNAASVRRVLAEVARRRQEGARRIGARIAELREQHHLTQQVAADRLGVGYRTYQTWEAGDATPRWHNLEKLGKFYRVSVDEILGNPPVKMPDQLDRVEERLTEIEHTLSKLILKLNRSTTAPDKAGRL